MAGLFYKRPPEATSSESLWVRMGLHLLVGTHNDSGRVYGNSSSHCRGLVSTIMSNYYGPVFFAIQLSAGRCASPFQGPKREGCPKIKFHEHYPAHLLLRNQQMFWTIRSSTHNQKANKPFANNARFCYF